MFLYVHRVSKKLCISDLLALLTKGRVCLISTALNQCPLDIFDLWNILFILDQICHVQNKMLTGFYKTEAISDQCSVDDEYVCGKTVVFRGRIYLMDQRLQKAFHSNQNHFKMNVIEYYYYANKH